MTDETYNESLMTILFIGIIFCVIGISCCQKNDNRNLSTKTTPSTPISSPTKSTEKSTDFVDIDIDGVDI